MIPQISTPTPTPAENALRRCTIAASRTIETVHAEYLNGYNEVWHNTACTPGEVLALMETSAASFFAVHAATGQYLAAVCPLVGVAFTPLSAPDGLTIHQDGTATYTPQEGGGE